MAMCSLALLASHEASALVESPTPTPTARAKAVIRDATGAVKGTLYLTEYVGSGLLDQRIDVVGTVNGLPPNATLGLHLRSGDCSASGGVFTTAGDHVDFSGSSDAFSTHPRDEGDLPNVTTDANGRASIRLTKATNRFTLKADPLLNLFSRSGGPVAVGIDASRTSASSFETLPMFCGELRCETGACDDEMLAPGTSPETALRACSEILAAAPGSPNGPYWIDPDADANTADAFQTWCDMAGGGWTMVAQNNRAVVTNGNLAWAASTGNGVTVRGGTFGANPEAFDLWVGLSEWNLIGSTARLEVGAVSLAPTKQATFDISIGTPAQNYFLNLSNPVLVFGSTLPGLYTYHRNRAFTAFDVDNDDFALNCSPEYGYPWWYGACWNGSLWGSDTGNYLPAAYWEGSQGDFHNWGAIWLR